MHCQVSPMRRDASHCIACLSWCIPLAPFVHTHIPPYITTHLHRPGHALPPRSRSRPDVAPGAPEVRVCPPQKSGSAAPDFFLTWQCIATCLPAYITTSPPTYIDLAMHCQVVDWSLPTFNSGYQTRPNAPRCNALHCFCLDAPRTAIQPLWGVSQALVPIPTYIHP